VWSYPKRVPRIRRLLNDQTTTKTVLLLRSQTDINSFLMNATTATSASV
jgi:hypothetical protein